jgi:hypothetical protein
MSAMLPPDHVRQLERKLADAEQKLDPSRHP